MNEEKNTQLLDRVSAVEKSTEQVAKLLCCILDILQGSSQLATIYQNPSNPVAIPWNVNGQGMLVLQANPNRKQFVVVNEATQPLAVQYGSPGASVHELQGTFSGGDGGELSDEIWKGSVYLVSIDPSQADGSATVSELV